MNAFGRDVLAQNDLLERSDLDLEIQGTWCQKNRAPITGIRHASWHVLRHTFASELARRGVSLQMIKELLGHATITMTLRYAHLSPDVLHQAIAVLDDAGAAMATWRQPDALMPAVGASWHAGEAADFRSV